MPKFIVANGCSFTHEYYLSKEDRWTTRCGVNVNLALGGGGNDRIFHTTLEYLNQHRPDVLIIGWSACDRFMLPNKNGSRIVGSPWRTFDENTGIDCNEHSDFYYEHCHNFYTSFERTLNYMLHLDAYCKSNAIKLLHFNAWLPDIDDKSLMEYATNSFMNRDTKDIAWQGIQTNKRKLSHLIEKLDRKNWIKEFWCSMPKYCKDFPLEKDGHPGIEGSKHWAELVASHL